MFIAQKIKCYNRMHQCKRSSDNRLFRKNNKATNLQYAIINYQFKKGVYVVKSIMNNGEIKTERLVVE